jgi:formylmethanofuran dehydrogenase subunit C
MLKLTYRNNSLIPLESDWLSPDQLRNKSLSEISTLPILHGNREQSLGDFFQMEGDPLDEILLIEGDCSRIKGLGRKMISGTLTIHGDAGLHLGAEMMGGKIEVFGNVSDWCGAEMRNGIIRIHGNANNNLGAAYRGSIRGMRGGLILVKGNCGHEVGSTMRRGWIVIGGDSGDFLGISMIAGSIFVMGHTGNHPGAGMKRGTIALFGTFDRLPTTFRYDCDYQPGFLKLYLKHLRQQGFPLSDELESGYFRRYTGDLLTLGKGEILHRIV